MSCAHLVLSLAMLLAPVPEATFDGKNAAGWEAAIRAPATRGASFDALIAGGARAVPLVLELEWATSIIEEIGPAAVPMLAQAVAWGKDHTFQKALRLWLRLAPDSLEPARTLLHRFDGAVSSNLIERAFRGKGTAAAPLLDPLLRRKTGKRTPQGLRALSVVGTAPKALLRLVMTHLEGENRRNHIEAVRALRAFGEHAAPAVPQLIEAIDSADCWTARLAVETLRGIGPKAEAAIPALARLMHSGRLGSLRAEAAYSHAVLGGPVEDSAKVLASLIIKKGQRRLIGNMVWHDEVVELIGALGPAAKAAVPALLISLRAGWRTATMEALGRMGHWANDALPRLHEARTEGGPDVRLAAAVAIFRIDGEAKQPVKTLVDLLDDLPQATARALVEFGPEAAPAIPGLKSLAQSRWRNDRVLAMRALASIAPDTVKPEPERARYNGLLPSALVRQAIEAQGTAKLRDAHFRGDVELMLHPLDNPTAFIRWFLPRKERLFRSEHRTFIRGRRGAMPWIALCSEDRTITAERFLLGSGEEKARKALAREERQARLIEGAVLLPLLHGPGVFYEAEKSADGSNILTRPGLKLHLDGETHLPVRVENGYGQVALLSYTDADPRIRGVRLPAKVHCDGLSAAFNPQIGLRLGRSHDVSLFLPPGARTGR